MIVTALTERFGLRHPLVAALDSPREACNAV
jgi:hypothetical protein